MRGAIDDARMNAPFAAALSHVISAPRVRALGGLAVLSLAPAATALAESASPRFAPEGADAALLPSLAREISAHGVSAQSAESASTAAPAAAPANRPYGAADTFELEIAAGPAFEFDGATLAVLDVGVHWFVADGLSFGAFAEAVYFDGETNDAGGGGVGLLARWHFLRGEDYTLFAEGGCAFVLFSDDIPDGGTEHDFTPRAAIGATYELSEGVRLVGKAGWFHISNAQTGPTNPGLDSVSVMIGLSFTLGQ
jgi:hypothetical protein